MESVYEGRGSLALCLTDDVKSRVFGQVLGSGFRIWLWWQKLRNMQEGTDYYLPYPHAWVMVSFYWYIPKNLPHNLTFMLGGVVLHYRRRNTSAKLPCSQPCLPQKSLKCSHSISELAPASLQIARTLGGADTPATQASLCRVSWQLSGMTEFGRAVAGTWVSNQILGPVEPP